MIDHRQAQRLAADAVDFALTSDEQIALDGHLSTCAPCRAFADQLANDALALAMLPTIDAPDRLRASVLMTIAGGDPGELRRERAPFVRSRTFLALTAASLVVAIVAGTLVWSAGRPATDPGVADVSPAASLPGPTGAGSSAEPSPGGEPSGQPGGQPGDAPPAAALAASGDTGGVVPLDAGFTLTSLDGTPAAALAARLSVGPSMALAVEPSLDGTSVRLTPAEPLLPGVVYRFTLTNAAGTPVDSWAFQAEQPLRVVGTLPGDQQTEVPLRTGIEITFDQDGVKDAASHVTIEPATKGRFEEHGRVLVFVPEGLKPKTVYTVTVRRGVSIPATGQALAKDVQFRFETLAPRGEQAVTSQFAFATPLVEWATATRPVISADAWNDEGTEVKSAPIEVYRLADMASAIDAFHTISDAPGWAQWSTAGVVPTAGLQRVVSYAARLQGWFRLPAALPAGWYLVQHPAKGRPAQAILQVTDVAAYLALTTTRSLVWANDLKTGRPLPGATVELEGGVPFGQTDDQGLAVAPTPTQLLDREDVVGPTDPAPVVIIEAVDGRAAFLPRGSAEFFFDGFDGLYGTSADVSYWHLLHSDRLQYRSTDTINAWGMVRERGSVDILDRVELRLVVQDYGVDAARPPLVTLLVEPGTSGMFTGSIPLKDMPDGGYQLELRVDGRVIASTELTVGPIAKPAYRLEVETGSRVYIEGDRVKTTVRATFFEGSAVPGVRLRVEGGEWPERTTTTDRTGTAAVRNTARVSGETGREEQSAYVSVARAEEGEITAFSRPFLVFPSSRMIEADGQVRDGRVRVTGSVHVVDVERIEREIDAGASVYEVDPRGRAVSGTTVTARFTEQIPVRTRVGEAYDFIAKAVVPLYEYRVNEVDAGVVRVKTGADGRFEASIPTPAVDHDYQVSVTVVDRDGRRAREDVYATPATARADYDPEQDGRTFLERTVPMAEETYEYGVGETVDLTMRSSRTENGGQERYLFYVARSGLREATVRTSTRFTTSFDESALPNLDVYGVRFTGATYVVAESFGARFRATDRQLKVDLTVRDKRYAPGGQATVDIRTRTATGRPISATVVLRAVDEKLFAIDAAAEVDALHELYASLPSGLLSTYASHSPYIDRGGGDTGGGGDDGRSEFVDSLLFTAVETDSQGRGTVSFGLSDDLTSWHVSAAAINAALEAGSATALVPVGLPFFVDAVIAPEYLTADRPAIPITAYGSDLKAGAKVAITVESSSLGLRTRSLAAQAFKDVTVSLPRLTPGVHTLTITATSGSGASALRDRLTRTFRVVDSRLTRSRTSYATIGSGGRPDGGQGLTTYLVSDAGRGRYLPLLLELAGDPSSRLDQALAADLARSMLVDDYQTETGPPPASDFSRGRYQAGDDGLALLPYASSDLQLSALVALVAPDRTDRAALERYLTTIVGGADETRERRTYALAGLAGLERPVLPDIRALAARTDLTIRERLMVGLAAAALGDAGTARSIEGSLADEHLESLGSSARLRVGTTAADMTTATALMALLAAWNGSSIAQGLWDYVESNPSADELHALHAVGFVAHMLERLPSQPARFAFTIAGKREVVDLAPGESFELTVDAAQRSSLTFESLRGATGLAATWREPVRAADFERDPDVRIARTVRPSGRIDTGDLVRVDLTVTFGQRAATGCRQVTDLVPSGLSPLGPLASWPYEEDEESPSQRIQYQQPYEQTGQRVYFCAEPTKKVRVVQLRYYARVVTPGTYRWEPAVAQVPGATDRAVLTPTREVTIR